MSFVNALFRTAIDLLVSPFQAMPPLVPVIVISIVTAIAILFVFKYTSNQTALEDVKRKIHAGLFEIRLYNDDFRAILRAQFAILRANFTYMRHTLKPMLWTLPPLFLVIAQLQFHYGYEGLHVDEPVLLKVTLSDGAYAEGTKPSLDVTVPDGLELETPSVWIPTLGEMAWRLTAEAPGDYELEIRGSSATVTKTVVARSESVRRSPFKIRGFWNELLYPAEPPLPESEFEAITVSYPETELDIFGLQLHWLIWFFILSMVFAFALRKPFGVTI